jgi:pyruvate dehydrogenase E2 component (dihydrolipoamide acetyltransferase)
VATTKEIHIPDIGGATHVDVIEVLVAPGAKIKKEQSLITLEGDKATMEIPSPEDGIVEEIKIKVGDKVAAGTPILTLRSSEETSTMETVAPPPSSTKPLAAKPAAAAGKTAEKEVRLPDIGSAAKVSVIEVSVKVGDEVKVEQPLITLEGDKATMEIPSPYAGKITQVKLKVGDKVTTGDVILMLQTTDAAQPTTTPAAAPKVEATSAATSTPAAATAPEVIELTASNADVHAGPGVRRLAREFGVELGILTGSGEKGRILKEDVQAYVKTALQKAKSAGLAVPAAPIIDFSKFGAIETKPLNKIKRLTGINVHRSWITVPHVTQFDEADITELEAFRQSQKNFTEAQGVKLTPLVFIMKAVVAALKKFPTFNASLDSTGENLILKKYFHLGIAVDTPNGLVVPVIRDVDQKGMLEIAKELAVISKKAREKGLTPVEMSGSSFTISSLGGIGGTAFTPIVNTPDVAILGISRSSQKPVYQNGQFVPRLMLPLSLSYDHRVVDGADGARFITYVANLLADIRTLLL